MQSEQNKHLDGSDRESAEKEREREEMHTVIVREIGNI